MSPFAFVNLRKGAGASSTQAGVAVRRRLRRYFSELGVTEKPALGHFGTLDPLAEGVLPLAIGKATRLFPLIEDRRKRYVFTLVLGIATTSGDAAGEVSERAAVPLDIEARLCAALPTFLGQTEQLPPMASALKHQGKRLYELDRAGIVVERAPRPVVIDALELVEGEIAADPGGDTIAFRLRVRCGEGTYVRTLCEDIARAIGTVGHMRALLREAAGPFELATARTWEEIDADPAGALLDPREILPFASLELSGEALMRFRNGQPRLLKEGMLAAAGIEDESLAARTVFVTVQEHAACRIVGVGVLLGKQLVPHSVFA